MQDEVTEKTLSDVEHGRTAVQRQQVDVVDGVQSSSAERPSEPTADSSTAAPDGGYGWVVVFATFAISFIHDGIMQSFGVLYVDLLDYFGADKTRTSLIGSVYSAVGRVAGLPAGILVNRYGCRPVTIAGSVILTFGLVISRFAGSINVLTVTFGVIAGFGTGTMYLPTVVAVSVYFKKRRALATGIAMCGTGVGNFVLAPVTSVLLEQLGWKNVMFVFGAITLQGCVLGGLFRPLTDKPSKPDTQRDRRASTVEATERPTSSSSVSPDEVEMTEPANGVASSTQSGTVVDAKRSVLSRMRRIVRACGLHLLADPFYVGMLVGDFIGTLGFLTSFYFITDRAILLGIETTQAAFLISAIGIANTVGRILIGLLANVKHVSPLLLFNVAVLTAGVAGLLVRFCVVYWAMVVYALVFGLCAATWMTLTSVVLCDLLGPDNLSRALGMLFLIRGASDAAGSPLNVAVASLFAGSNVYDVTFTIAGVEFLVAGAIFCLTLVLLWRRRRTLEISSP